jgi:ABC-type sugar transport system ATPase subunit
MAMADDLAVLDNGRIAQIGTPAEVWDTPACLAAATALSPLNLWRGSVSAGRLDTPFGAVATTLPDGSAAIVAVRQSCLHIIPGATARIVERRRVGDAVEAVIAPSTIETPVWRARISHGDVPTPGPCSIDLTGAGVFVFAA